MKRTFYLLNKTNEELNHTNISQFRDEQIYKDIVIAFHNASYLEFSCCHT